MKKRNYNNIKYSDNILDIFTIDAFDSIRK